MSNYTINTLEKLCYNEVTAKKAFELIYKLATSESELKQEAYSRFVDLFQVVLAETSIDLNSRLAILQELQAKELTTLLISAYERGLKAFGFIGHIHDGDDDIIKKQYNPNAMEWSKYHSAIINILKDIVLNDYNNLGSVAKEALFSRLVDQIYYGEEDLMLAAIEEITNHENKIDLNLRNKLLEFTTKKADLFEDTQERIKLILEKFQPQGIEEQLKIDVIEAPWLYDKEENGQTVNISSKKAIELATKYYTDKTNWLPFLKLLLKGEQRQTFYFAFTMAELGYDKNSIIDKLIEDFKTIPLEEQNSVFINGLVLGTKDNNFTRDIISKLIVHPETEVHGIRQVRFLNPITFSDLEVIKPLLLGNSEYLRNLEYIDLKSLSDSELKDAISWLKNLNYSFALEILNDLVKDYNRWDTLKDFINKLIFVDGMLHFKSFIRLNLHIEELLVQSIKDNPSEENVHFLIKQIITDYENYEKNESLLDRLTYFLLTNYWEISWPFFSDYLVKTKSDASYGLNDFFRKFKFDNEKLYQWAIEDKKDNPSIAMKLMDIYVNNADGTLSWNPFAKKLIDEFGNQRSLLNNLSSKLGSYMIYNSSAEELYKKRKKMVEELLNSQLKEVVDFAKNEIIYFDKRIEDEKKSGENYELRR